MSLEEKRREKQGDYNKKEVLDYLYNELDGIDEFVIAKKYKDGTVGMSSTTSDPITAIGTLEQSKLIVLGELYHED